jgi:hypothetical protein
MSKTSIAFMILYVILSLAAACALASCADSPAPKKTGPLDSCVSLGCGDTGDGYCTQTGRCACAGEACQREHGLHFVDAGVSDATDASQDTEANDAFRTPP